MGSLVDVGKEDAPCHLYLLINELQLIKKMCVSVYVCMYKYVCIFVYFFTLVKISINQF